MDEIKKVCFLIPSLQSGGMERVMSELINQFSKNKALELHLVLYGIKRDIFYSVPGETVIHKPPFTFNNSYRLFSTFRTLIYLRKEIKAINPLTILSFGEIWNNFVLLALLGLKYPVYVSDRCQPNKSLGRFHNFLRKHLYPKARGVVAQTLKAKEIFQEIYHHNNIKVIGNPIRSIKSNVEIEKENIVLTVGRLITTKHHDELIKLFADIKKADWKMIIIGDDALKQQNKVRLEKLIDELQISDKVILAGRRDDVDNFYLKSKIFAFTSSSEGFPNVIGEAMSAGLPVVSFDCIAGPSDMIVDGENGFLIPLFDYELFRKKLTLLMEDEMLRTTLGNNARILIKNFASDKISKRFKEFIH